MLYIREYILDVDYKRKSYEFSPEKFLDFLDKA